MAAGEATPGPIAPRRPPAGTWRRLLAFAPRWPMVYRRAHLGALVLLPVELLTGAILYFPTLHTGLIAALPAVLAIHVWSGVLFGLLLIVPMAQSLGRRWVARLDWQATIWLIMGLSLTGLGLWTGGVPGLIRQGAFTLHGALSIAILLWVAYHGLVRLEAAFRGSDAQRAAAAHGHLQRRGVLGQALRGLAATAGLTVVLGGLQRAQAALRTVGATGGTAQAGGPGSDRAGPQPIPGFQIYTVTGRIPDQSRDPGSWRLTVEGAVDQPLTLSLDDLMQLPQTTFTADFHCVTGWVVPQVTWTGVKITDLLAKVQPKAVAAWVTFDSFDGAYTDSLSLEQAAAPGVLLAHHANGAPLAPEQGAPVRLVVPQMYGYKSVKWVSHLHLVAGRDLGYWEHRGYGPDAYVGTVNGWPGGAGILGGLWP